MTRILRPLALPLVFACFIFVPLAAWAQEQEPYRIGPEDVLSITFWQQRDLNQVVRVRTDGVVALPVIGETKVGGLTTEEAAERIVSRISRYNRNVSQALVQVTEFNSRRVFVSGRVGKPGQLGYENIPDLWTVIRDAGGPMADADLTRVSVVQPTGTIQVINLTSILSAGKADTLPLLLSGTAVDVPAKLVPGATFPQESAGAREAVVYVTGHVTAPGPVPVKEQMSVHEAIAQAGGIGLDGDLKKVTVLSKASGRPVTHAFDLRPDAKDRGAFDYQMQYEDIVIVGQKGGGFVGTLPALAAVAAIITSVILVVDYFDTTPR